MYFDDAIHFSPNSSQMHPISHSLPTLSSPSPLSLPLMPVCAAHKLLGVGASTGAYYLKKADSFPQQPSTVIGSLVGDGSWPSPDDWLDPV